jgi:Protein of unknown function (DUF2281)
MSVHEQAIDKLRQLPDALAIEVADFIDFLLTKHPQNETALPSPESLETVESDFSDYLKNLEDYEDRLARGEIQW